MPMPRERSLSTAFTCRLGAKEREVALTYDRITLLFFGEGAETSYPPVQSEHVILPDDIMRQIKAGRPPH